MSSNNKKTTISRKDLYDLVWTKPTKTLSAELGISDVMISKICKKHQIPKPGLGYWSRFENGYKDPITPLPFTANKQLEIIHFTQNTDKPGELELPKSLAEMIAHEDLIENKIIVSEKLGKLHPVLANARAKIAEKNYLDQGLVGTYQTGIHLRVSRENIDKSLKILSALIAAFEKRELPFSIREATRHHKEAQFPIVTIQGVDVEFRLQERLRRTKLASLDQIKDKEFRKQLSWEFSPGKELLIPSGDLYIQIETYTSIACKKLWEDSPKKPLELQLNDILKGFILASAAIKKFNDERDADRAKRELEWKIYEEEKAEREAKAERAKALCELANEIFEYQKVKELKQKLAAKSDDPEFNAEIKELSKWIDEYFSNPDPITAFLKAKIRPLL